MSDRQPEVRRGRVKWFNHEKGFGFISPDDGGPDIFVHYSSIRAIDPRLLEEHQLVEFEVVDGPKGPQAIAIRAGSGHGPDSAPRPAPEPPPYAGTPAPPPSRPLGTAEQSAIRRIFQPPTAAPGTLPVTIYLASATGASELELAVVELLDLHGVDIVESPPPVIGSWFAKRKGRIRHWRSTEEAAEVAARLERVLTVRTLDTAQAEVDLKQAEAVAHLMKALENQDDACIQVGSLFLLKVDGTTIVRNLTPRELTFLSRHPSVLATPRQVLAALEEYAEAAPPLETPSETAMLPQPGRTPLEP